MLREDLLVVRELTMAEAFHRHGGRGPGLTPEGDDLLMGLVAGRRAARRPGADHEAAELTAWAERAAGEPSRSLLRHAAAGELVEPAHDVLAAAAADDPGALSDAARELVSWGASSGRALLTGLVAGMT